MKKCFVCMCVLLFFGTASAGLWYVHPDSVQNCIDDCLDSCSVGDTVLVGPGTYYENIVWPEIEGIKLISESGAASTVIDGNYAGRVIAVSVPVDTTTLIKGFTIQNGYRAGPGGGVYLRYASPIVSDNIITMNYAWNGAGIYLESNRAIIRFNEITYNNVLADGAGIHCTQMCRATILHNLISNNTAPNTPSQSALGGGIYCGWVDSSWVGYNTITQNIARVGGAIACSLYCGTKITRNTITENTASLGAVSLMHGCSNRIHKNTISTNTATMGTGGIECWFLSSPLVDSCRIAHNIGDGVRTDSMSEPVLFNNNIYDNTNLGVANYDSTVTVDADSNWWGDSSGPSLYGPGSGEEVSNWVDYDPWLKDSVEWPGVEEYTTDEVVNVILSAYPNPFSKLTTISFEVDSRQKSVVSIQIYDITGRLVKQWNYPTIQLSNVITWAGDDNTGRQLPSGVYFLKLQGGEYSKTAKLLLVR